MVLPASGPLSLSQIRAEFNKGDNLAAYYNAASGVPASGQLNISHFYGKSAVLEFVYSQYNHASRGHPVGVNIYNLFVEWFGQAAVNAAKSFRFINQANITSSVDAIFGTPASVYITGFPSGSQITFINQATIAGRGGRGGTPNQGTYHNPANPVAHAGEAGHHGLYIDHDATVLVAGHASIYGGGGGGGGGGWQAFKSNNQRYYYMFGGGGGGASALTGTGPTSNSQHYTGNNNRSFYFYVNQMVHASGTSGGYMYNRHDGTETYNQALGGNGGGLNQAGGPGYWHIRSGNNGVLGAIRENSSTITAPGGAGGIAIHVVRGGYNLI